MQGQRLLLLVCCLATREMAVQAGVAENSPESSSSKDGDDADNATRKRRIGFINNNGPCARDHRTVTGLVFVGTLVACERMGVGVLSLCVCGG